MGTENTPTGGSPVERVVRPQYALRVSVHADAVHAIPNPNADPHIGWVLRYAPHRLDDSHNLVAAEILDGFDYLLSIPMKEATRRLRLLRAARKDSLRPNA